MSDIVVVVSAMARVVLCVQHFVTETWPTMDGQTRLSREHVFGGLTVELPVCVYSHNF